MARRNAATARAAASVTDPGPLVAELERKQAMLAEAQRLARIGSWEWDLATGVVTWSDELFRIYGAEPQSFEPTYEAFMARVHPDDRASIDERNRRALSDMRPFEDVKRVFKEDGSEFLLRTQGEVVRDAEGAPASMVGVCEDVTDRVRAAEAHELLASIVRSSNDAIFTVSTEGVVTSWNPAAERLFGYPAPEAIGMGVERLVPSDALAEDRAVRERVLAGAEVDPWEARRRRRDGALLDVSIAVSRIPGGLSVIVRDVTERRRFESRLRHLADHDALTGAFNRRRFEEEVSRAVEHTRRYGGGGAVIVLDLDNFKYVNDTLGHGAGDELVRTLAALLRARLRGTDVLARLGGDEFAILLPRAGAQEARVVAREIVTGVRRHGVVLDGRRVRATASVGVAIFDTGAEDGHELLACADAAMYEAKESGRDRAVVYAAADGVTARVRAGAGWEHRITEALDEDRFELHAQPILDLRERTVARYELLLRMREPGGEITLPAAFLPAAERLGLIHEIDRWVAQHAIALAERHPGLDFEVNVSGRSLDDAELLDSIAFELARREADPARLVFEITETATITNMEDARRFAESLASLGCQFAIDDFGAGFGSFSYLKRLPAAYLKIDGDFVRSPRTRTDEAVIEAIVGIARGLGKRTIAEFVGDDETIAMLTEMGIDFAQGDHVGRPFPVEELAAR